MPGRALAGTGGNMICSMTGFGRGEQEGGGYRVQAEIRTLNHRFLDLHVRLPRLVTPLEDRLRKLVASRLARGRVELNLVVEPAGESAKGLVLDLALLPEVLAALEELRRLGNITAPVSLDHLLRFPELLTIKDKLEVDPETLWEPLAGAVTQALEAVHLMRRQEGENLKTELTQRLELIQTLLRDIGHWAQEVPRCYREKLADRLQDLLPEPGMLDDARLLQEVACLADRADITEELTRLASHVEQIGLSLEAAGPVGRKLDFLVQEMHREINTVGSKAADLKISQAVIDVKTELERLREQIQNIE